MQKKMKIRALVMGATALTTSFMLAGTAAASGGPNCSSYASYSEDYCRTLGGWEGASCMVQVSQSVQQCFAILNMQTLTASEMQRLANQLSWPGR